MRKQGLGWKEAFKNPIPLYLNPGDEDTQAYQHDQYLSRVSCELK